MTLLGPEHNPILIGQNWMNNLKTSLTLEQMIFPFFCILQFRLNKFEFSEFKFEYYMHKLLEGRKCFTMVHGSSLRVM